jgi:hypothetical protein
MNIDTALEEATDGSEDDFITDCTDLKSLRLQSGSFSVSCELSPLIKFLIVDGWLQ